MAEARCAAWPAGRRARRGERADRGYGAAVEGGGPLLEDHGAEGGEHGAASGLEAGLGDGEGEQEQGDAGAGGEADGEGGAGAEARVGGGAVGGGGEGGGELVEECEVAARRRGLRGGWTGQLAGLLRWQEDAG